MRTTASTSATAGTLQVKTVGIIFMVIIMIIVLLTVCKEKPIPVDPAAVQKEFTQNLKSQPAPDFAKELAYTTLGEYTIVKMPAGETISYRKDTTVYRGTLETDLYCVLKNDGPTLADGSKVIGGPKGEIITFQVNAFPQGEEWNQLALIQFNEIYPLTILTKEFHAVIENYEELRDSYDPDGESVFVLGEPVPAYIVETPTGFYLYGKELQPWRSHKQVAAAKKK
jgi:hypothetical protein